MTRSVDKGMCCRRGRRHVTEEAYKLGLLFTILSIVGCLIAGSSFISTGLNAKIVYRVVNVLVGQVTERAYKLAWIFTILNILGCLIAVLLFISTGLNAKTIFYSVNVLVSMLCWLPILCGHIFGKRSHRMYLPFLFLFAISTVYTSFEILYLVMQRILMFKSPDSIYVMFGVSLKEYEQLAGNS
uniref:Aa_trans domain-containing protein n=1 Tax=Globodera pallida TaxID=36090 RepID=A0A183BM26_GLOPA